MLRALMVAAALAISADCAQAWDNEAPTPLPLLEGTLPEGVEFKSVRVDVVDRQVTVSYPIFNSGAKEATLALASYSVPFGRTGLLDEYPDKSFSEQTVSIDGVTLNSRVHVTTLHGGIDVGSSLKRLGVDGLKVLIDDKAREAWSPKIVRQLGGLGLVDMSSPAAWPRWNAVVSKAWTIHLQPRKISTLQIQYRAQPGVYLTEPSGLLFKKGIGSYCADPANVAEKLTSEIGGTLLTDVVVQEFVIPVRVAGWAPDDIAFTYRSTKASADAPAGMLMVSCDHGVQPGRVADVSQRMAVMGNTIGFVLLTASR